MIRDFVKSASAAALLLIAAPGAITQSMAQSVQDHLGPLQATVGQSGEWTASLTGGWFLLTNRENAGSIRYFSAEGPKLNPGGSRTIKSTVIVLPHQGADAYGGILFDFAGSDGYFAFTIAGDGRVILWDRTPDGFKDQVAQNVRAKLDGSDVLEVRETPTETTFHINGERVFTSNSQQGFYPSYGIVAIGAGRFGFDGYSVDLVEGAGGLQPPGDSDLPPPGGDETAELPPPGGDQGGQTGGQTDPFAGASPEDVYRAKVVLGTTLGVFFHEFGHALIGETKLPATGPEEDVADGFSAFVLSSTVTEAELGPEMQAFFADVVKYSSLLYYYMGVLKEVQGSKHPWQDEHAPDMQRFRNTFCIIYGSDPQRYDQLADQVRFGDRAKQRCQIDYKKRYDAWETILKTVARDLGPDSPGVHPADAPGGKLVLNFVESQNPYGDAVEAILRDTGVMKELLMGLERMFVWPRDVSVTFRDCEQVNAWYNPNDGSVTMCYQLVEMTSNIVFKHDKSGTIPGGDQQGGGQQGGGQQGPDPAQFLLGLWQMQGAGPGNEVLAAFAQDGSYQLQRTSGGIVYSEVGQWQVQMAGQQQIQLQQRPSQAQQCDQYNQCQQMQVQGSTIMVQVRSQDMITTEGVTWQRLQQR